MQHSEEMKIEIRRQGCSVGLCLFCLKWGVMCKAYFGSWNSTLYTRVVLQGPSTNVPGVAQLVPHHIT